MDRPTDPVLLPYRHDQRLERLAGWLARDLARAPLANPLAREWIVVPHPGMGRWLERELARHWGIAAALELALPGRVLWEFGARVAGIEGLESPWERERLALRILALLPDVGTGRDAVRWPAGVRASLEQPRAAWELAQLLARRYGEYLVHRPHWILAWERGERCLPLEPDEAWQAALWRRLVAGATQPHRATVRESALERLAAAPPGTLAGLPSRLSVFALPTIAPPQLELLAGLARHLDLRWYHLNPGSGWWADMRSPQELARRRAMARAGKAVEARDDDDPGHPLLASWGRIGRDFLQVLYDQAGFEVHESGEGAPPPSGHLLGWLQLGLHQLDPRPCDPPPLAKAGDSLQVCACASPLREVEVLHDALLAAFDADRSLAPHEVVVMTPDLARYGALVDAVFGAAPEGRRIPWGVADRGAGSGDGAALVGALLALLALPQSRLRVGEVIDLLRVPSIARRCGIGPGELAQVQVWVDAIGVHWGLDAEFRRQLDLGNHPDGSWRTGLDRLWLGMATGPVDGLVAGTRPWTDIEGGAVELAGTLTRLVESLAAWRRRLQAPHPASAWADAVRSLLAEFCDEDSGLPEERAALDAVRDALSAFEVDARLAGSADAELAQAAMHAELCARIAQPAPRQVFPGSGVTVCAMVPMRNLPFRRVYVLGLDDSRFPRPRRDDGHDLLRAAPQPGDRELRDEDRYLFLEILLAAREHLCLSYTHVSPRDGVAQPASSLVEELLEFVQRAYAGEDRDAIRATLVRRYPATAYAAANFAPEPPGSYAAQWLPLARAASGTAPAQAALPWPSAPAPAHAGSASVALDELLRFVRHPARDMARRLLGYVPDDTPPLDDSESFELDGLGEWRLRDRLVGAIARHEAGRDELLARTRAEGLLPAGHAGGRAFDTQWHRARDMVDMLRRHPGLPSGELPQPIALSIDGLHLHGTLSALDSRGVVLARAGKWHGSHALELALSSVVARAAGRAPQPAWGIGESGDELVCWRLDPARLPPDWLARLLATWHQAQFAPLPLWRRASWAYAATPPGKGPAAHALATWQGDGRHHCELDDDASALLARAFADPLGTEFVRIAEALLVPVSAALEVVDG